MSILNSVEIRDLSVSSNLAIFLAKLGVRDAREVFDELCDEIESEFTVCCNLRHKYCDCESEAEAYAWDRKYDEWKDNQLMEEE